MKPIILSADADRYVYQVPNDVADHLYDYCMAFLDWLSDAPEADSYRHISKSGTLYLAYNEADFIQYLNRWIFPNEPSTLVENIGFQKIPTQYKGCPKFNF